MDRRLRIGILGLHFGEHILRELLHGAARALFQVVAVCDLESDRARAAAALVARESGPARAHATLDSLLSDANVEVVGLFTGPAGRAELIGRIIRSGRDVLTTKPFENDPVAALRVLQEAAALGRVVHLNSPSPLPSADLAIIEAWVTEHRLGRIVGAHADVWASYREKPDGSWYDDPRLCPVAPILRLGIYVVNDIVHFMGAPDRVQVLQGRVFTERPTADNAVLSLGFPSGAVATVFASFCVGDGQPYRNGLVLNFEGGTVYRNVGPPQIPSARAELSLLLPSPSREPRVLAAHTSELSGDYQWAALHRAVTTRKTEGMVSAEEVVAGVDVLARMAAAALQAG